MSIDKSAIKDIAVNLSKRFLIVFWLLVGILDYSIALATESNDLRKYPHKKVSLMRQNYIDYAYCKGNIWAITAGGKLIVWNIQNSKTVKTQSRQTLRDITSVSVTGADEIYIGTKRGEIYRWEEKKNIFKRVSKINGAIYKVFIVDGNRLYAITDQGVVNIETKQLNRPEKSFNRQINETKKDLFWLGRPSAITIDTMGNIWIGYNYGEWGGDLHVFSTKNESYMHMQNMKFPAEMFKNVPPNQVPGNMITYTPIKSIFEGRDGIVFITSGIEHVFLHSAIWQFNNTNDSWKGSLVYWSAKTDTQEGEFIGPGYFDKNIGRYFYFADGTMYYSDDLSLSLNTIWKPYLRGFKVAWTPARLAAGYDIGMLKFEFIDKKTLVFLTRHDGIGIFDGKEIKVLK